MVQKYTSLNNEKKINKACQDHEIS